MLFKRRTVQADFEREVMPHLQALYGVALRMTKSEGDAEDLVQDALLRAYRFWDGFEAGSNCRAWLMRILTNVFPNLGQFQGAAPRDAESALFGRMLSRDVETALATLPPEFRLPVILADLEDLSYKEIADIMECPAGTVMSRLYRGRRMLQKQLSDYAMKASQADAVSPAAPVAEAAAEADSKLVDFDSFRRKKEGGRT